jgi:hypothetical protein
MTPKPVPSVFCPCRRERNPARAPNFRTTIPPQTGTSTWRKLGCVSQWFRCPSRQPSPRQRDFQPRRWFLNPLFPLRPSSPTYQYLDSQPFMTSEIHFFRIPR